MTLITVYYFSTYIVNLLLSYNDNAITYDTRGNPLNWIDGETLAWQKGRQLASYTKNWVFGVDAGQFIKLMLD